MCPDRELGAGAGRCGRSGRVGCSGRDRSDLGWYWAVDALRDAGFEVTLAHPRGVASMQGRRAKTDKLDAKELADLLRPDRLATAWTAPPEVRELRELVRYRHKLVGHRSATKASIHAVLGKCGVIPPIADIFGPVGSKMLDALVLPEPYAARVAVVAGTVVGDSHPQGLCGTWSRVLVRTRASGLTKVPDGNGS